MDERSVDDLAQRNEHTHRMLRRVGQLPEAYREPLMLRAMHGLRSKRIGEILGVPAPTVDTRIARARRMLREQAVQEECESDAADAVVSLRFEAAQDD